MLKKLIPFFILFAAASCNFTTLKNSSSRDLINSELSQKLNLSENERAQLSFDLINIKVLQPKCTSCHGTSGKVNLETYQNVVSVLQSIKESVFIKKSMPKRGFLNLDEEKLLWNWIEMGAPEIATTPTNEPPPEPLTATYTSIYTKIFVPKCVTCHSAGQSAERVLLTKDELLNSPLELILPENPDESGLVIAVERSDTKRMPPEKAGYSALNNLEKITIRKWIQDGATN